MSNQTLKTDKLKTKIINSSTQRQASDRFNIRFLGIVDNISDFMSRQVINATPRSISFDSARHNSRRTSFRDVGKLEVESLQVMFAPDDEGILETILTMQVMRQKGVEVTDFSDSGSEVFDIKIEYYNVKGEITHYELYKRCFIQTLTKPELNSQMSQPTDLSVTFFFDEVRYSFLDEEFFVN